MMYFTPFFPVQSKKCRKQPLYCCQKTLDINLPGKIKNVQTDRRNRLLKIIPNLADELGIFYEWGHWQHQEATYQCTVLPTLSVKYWRQKPNHEKVAKLNILGFQICRLFARRVGNTVNVVLLMALMRQITLRVLLTATTLSYYSSEYICSTNECYL